MEYKIQDDAMSIAFCIKLTLKSKSIKFTVNKNDWCTFS